MECKNNIIFKETKINFNLIKKNAAILKHGKIFHAVLIAYYVL